MAAGRKGMVSSQESKFGTNASLQGTACSQVQDPQMQTYTSTQTTETTKRSCCGGGIVKMTAGRKGVSSSQVGAKAAVQGASYSQETACTSSTSMQTAAETKKCSCCYGGLAKMAAGRKGAASSQEAQFGVNAAVQDTLYAQKTTYSDSQNLQQQTDASMQTSQSQKSSCCGAGFAKMAAGGKGTEAKKKSCCGAGFSKTAAGRKGMASSQEAQFGAQGKPCSQEAAYSSSQDSTQTAQTKKCSCCGGGVAKMAAGHKGAALQGAQFGANTAVQGALPYLQETSYSSPQDLNMQTNTSMQTTQNKKCSCCGGGLAKVAAGRRGVAQGTSYSQETAHSASQDTQTQTYTSSQTTQSKKCSCCGAGLVKVAAGRPSQELRFGPGAAMQETAHSDSQIAETKKCSCCGGGLAKKMPAGRKAQFGANAAVGGALGVHETKYSDSKKCTCCGGGLAKVAAGSKGVASSQEAAYSDSQYSQQQICTSIQTAETKKCSCCGGGLAKMAAGRKGVASSQGAQLSAHANVEDTLHHHSGQLVEETAAAPYTYTTEQVTCAPVQVPSSTLVTQIVSSTHSGQLTYPTLQMPPVVSDQIYTETQAPLPLQTVQATYPVMQPSQMMYQTQAATPLQALQAPYPGLQSNHMLYQTQASPPLQTLQAPYPAVQSNQMMHQGAPLLQAPHPVVQPNQIIHQTQVPEVQETYVLEQRQPTVEVLQGNTLGGSIETVEGQIDVTHAEHVAETLQMSQVRPQVTSTMTVPAQHVGAQVPAPQLSTRPRYATAQAASPTRVLQGTSTYSATQAAPSAMTLQPRYVGIQGTSAVGIPSLYTASEPVGSVTYAAPSMPQTMPMQGTYSAGPAMSTQEKPVYMAQPGESGSPLGRSTQTLVMQERPTSGVVYMPHTGQTNSPLAKATSVMVMQERPAAGSVYVPQSGSPLSKASSFVQERPTAGQGYMTQPASPAKTTTGMLIQEGPYTMMQPGLPGSPLSRALLSVQGPMANTRAFRKELTRLGDPAP